MGRKLSSVIQTWKFENRGNEVVISSMGRHPLLNAKQDNPKGPVKTPIMDSLEGKNRSDSNESLQENRQPKEPAYRRYIKM